MRILFFILWSCTSLLGQEMYKEVFKAMGSRFEVTVVAETEMMAKSTIAAAQAEIDRIEDLISSWDPKSQTSAINLNAGKEAVAVDEELFQLIKRSIGISQVTQGAFDITYASMDRLWLFDGSMTSLPSEEDIAGSVARIGWEKVVLDPKSRTVYLSEEGMKMGFGGIGKGYAAEKALEVLRSKGVSSAIVNAGGDLSAFGQQANGQPWRIGLTDPKSKNDVLAWIDINDQAVVTSGDYERYVEFNGARYAHILDPRTGWPTTGIKSVTVIASSAEMADALATSVFVLGIENGLYLINQLPKIECVIIDDFDQVLTSETLELNLVKPKNYEADQ